MQTTLKIFKGIKQVIMNVKDKDNINNNEKDRMQYIY